MARYMLDTNTCIAFMKGDEAIAEALLRRRPSQVCVSAITASELRFTALKTSAKRRQALDRFLESMEIAPYTLACSEAYAQVASQTRQQPIGDLDALIAAHAITLRNILVTSDSDFDRVRALEIGLKTEDWRSAD